MLIRLISLAILLLLIDVNLIALADNNFILPKDKPSVFKKIEKTKTSNKNLIPQSKPIIKTETATKKKEEIIEKTKELEKTVQKVEKKLKLMVSFYLKKTQNYQESNRLSQKIKIS